MTQSIGFVVAAAADAGADADAGAGADTAGLTCSFASAASFFVAAMLERSPMRTASAPGQACRAAAARSALRACRMTEWPRRMSWRAASEPRPSAEPVMRMRAMDGWVDWTGTGLDWTGVYVVGGFWILELGCLLLYLECCVFDQACDEGEYLRLIIGDAAKR